ncbi:class II D-tagatose-bisphosphate aldolase, non-catalytic subunit [bacterium]|nr:class II D-tagatose-bisphosphate aldolase, non-catalytic subunit [candidate division CSSED10-310 bacterium]
MTQIHPLQSLVNKHKEGKALGICSVCSANQFVLEAAINKGRKDNSLVLIEATSNQVNQFGGYTGMNPVQFAEFVYSLADDAGLPRDRLVLGGDHLGPLVWKNDSAEIAMEKACELIRQYVEAGFSKIHLDTSMRLGSDPTNQKLKLSEIAKRSEILFTTAEETYKKMQVEGKTSLIHPVYVIGSEVPIPGGAYEEEAFHVTPLSELKMTMEIFNDVFKQSKYRDSFNRVIAVVVQPGVEFSDRTVTEYRRTDAAEITKYVRQNKQLVLEGHSTDYQQASHLHQMAEDGIAILKVGPALTFALREALVALEHMESILIVNDGDRSLSCFSENLDSVMINKPKYWQNYYHGSEREQKTARLFSFSDRCRYYLNEPEVEEAIVRLIENLSSQEIPLALIRQYLPEQYWDIRTKKIENNVREIIRSKIIREIERYPSFKISE